MSILPQITDSIKLFADIPYPDLVTSLIFPDCVCYDFVFVIVLLLSTMLTIAGSWVPSLTVRAGAGILWIISLIFTLLSYLPVVLISALSIACIFMSIMGWVQFVVVIQGLRKKKEVTESDQASSESVEIQLLRQNNILLKNMFRAKDNETK
jgi:uncharacterized protein YhhL (DUF1145 family)